MKSKNMRYCLHKSYPVAWSGVDILTGRLNCHLIPV